MKEADFNINDDMGNDASHIDLEPGNNLPVITLSQKNKLENEIKDLIARLNESEHKRQETLSKN